MKIIPISKGRSSILSAHQAATSRRRCPALRPTVSRARAWFLLLETSSSSRSARSPFPCLKPHPGSSLFLLSSNFPASPSSGSVAYHCQRKYPMLSTVFGGMGSLCSRQKPLCEADTEETARVSLFLRHVTVYLHSSII